MSYKLNYMRTGNFGFITDKDEYEPGEPVRIIYNAIATDESNTFTVNADDTKIEYEGSVAVITFTMPDHDVDLKCSSSSMWSASPAPGQGTALDAFQSMLMFPPEDNKQE